ncbi:hypothetical protein [Salinisphaera sp. Q1T1-3]|uniref:hypothetical protein n=1 Tax=Salinisphaera sp. Q1T1-3 TaxID=2321229 RepID=UPI000E77082E|nr:hypothetical protein [Salinisphaera sp. Q1T1-3]RJS92743.1 hypothetical protein D3260_11020 [Salinisphaera sp. Q1T1-3]
MRHIGRGYTALLNAQGALFSWLGGLLGPGLANVSFMAAGIAAPGFWIGLGGVVLNLCVAYSGLRRDRRRRRSDVIAYGVVPMACLVVGLAWLGLIRA